MNFQQELNITDRKLGLYSFLHLQELYESFRTPFPDPVSIQTYRTLYLEWKTIHQRFTPYEFQDIEKYFLIRRALHNKYGDNHVFTPDSFPSDNMYKDDQYMVLNGSGSENCTHSKDIKNELNNIDIYEFILAEKIDFVALELFAKLEATIIADAYFRTKRLQDKK